MIVTCKKTSPELVDCHDDSALSEVMYKWLAMGVQIGRTIVRGVLGASWTGFWEVRLHADLPHGVIKKMGLLGFEPRTKGL